MDAIEYVDKTWNPYTGCKHIETGQCAVGKDCWAYNMARRLAGRYGYDKKRPFKPTFHLDRLDEPMRRKKPTRYAACFMGDIACASTEDVELILDIVRRTPRHTYYFLTKNPAPLMEITEWPKNAWLGVTVNEKKDMWRIHQLRKIDVKHWVSFEPLKEDLGMDVPYYHIEFIVIGAQTGAHPFQPEHRWVYKIVELARIDKIPVCLKENLRRGK